MGECEKCERPLPLADGVWLDDTRGVLDVAPGELFCCPSCAVAGVAAGELRRKEFDTQAWL